LAELLQKHRESVVALCIRMLGRRGWAEDAYQEAALEAMLGLGRLRDSTRFGPWLCGIALNVCRSWLRQAWRESPWEDAAALTGAGTDPAVAAEEAEIVRRVHEAVAALPPGQRKATTLFYLAGLTHQDIADSLGIPVGAVKTRLHKARASLRRRLSNELEEVHVDTKKLIDMRVADVRRYQPEEGGAPLHVVVLEEIGGDRQLPIWIGLFEATSIAIRLERAELPRPDTYSFVTSLLAGAQARVSEVRINRLANTVFYAESVVESPAGTAVVDARPSDALNLALLTDAPIRVALDVIEASLTREPNDFKGLEDGAQPKAGVHEIAAEAIERMKSRR
jgi:RNA polymerase sigma factor (sigma-70 family)